MLVLVTYDVATSSPGGAKRLRRVAKSCQDWGIRVQFSVFEIDANPAQWTALRARLLDAVDLRQDSLRFYFLGSKGREKSEHHGVREPLDLSGTLIL